MPRLPFTKSQLDANQVLQFAFNEDTGKLRVEAEVVATLGEVQIESSAADGDNIAISDGIDILNINADGSINTVVTNTVSISAVSLPLPSGASTSALQTSGNNSLSNIDTKVPANLTVSATRLLVDNSGVTQPVSAVSLPLPTGAATSAKQDTQAALLTDIKANQTNNTQVVLQKNASTTGNLTAATTSQFTAAVAGSVVQLSVPDGHSSWSVYLAGTFSAASQVSFEGSQTGADGTWFNLSLRRNADASTNDTTTVLDTTPFGGPAPTGGNPSHWRGNAGGIKFVRVRCQIYTAADNISVYIGSSAGVGTVFLNAAIPTGTNLIGQMGIKALTGFQVSQVAATITAVKVVSAGMTLRKSISIKARTSAAGQSWYIGHTSGATTTTTGYILSDGEAIELDLDPTQDVWAICTSSNVANRLYILESAGTL